MNQITELFTVIRMAYAATFADAVAAAAHAHVEAALRHADGSLALDGKREVYGFNAKIMGKL